MSNTTRDEKLPITVLVQTKNEEAAIARCLDSLTDFDEIIVVDSESEDRTKELCEEKSVSVVDFRWNGAYPKKKQWQLDNVATKYDWVLFLDADEMPTRDLVRELYSIFSTSHDRNNVTAYDIPIRYVFAGKTLQHGHKVVKRALVRKDRTHFPDIDDLDLTGMGELEGHYQPETDGIALRLSAPLFHDDPDPVRTWFDRHNRYSDWEAGIKTRQSARTKVRTRKTIQGRAFELFPLKPLLFFLYSYVFRRGFLDGREGFDYALALSFYYWQIAVKVREIMRTRDTLGLTERLTTEPNRARS